MKVSIITVCKNAEDTIKKTVRSVIGQTHADIEYLVIDGKSTDGTNKIINKYRNHIDVLISEKDNGIYSAMNKAIARASGEWLYFLNSGDTLFSSSTIATFARKATGQKDIGILYGDVMSELDGSKRLLKFNKVSRIFLLSNSICHQAIFSRRELYKKYGRYNLKYSIAADYEWLLRMIFSNKVKIKHINKVVSNYTMGGVSDKPKNRSRVLREYAEIREKYFTSLEILIYKIYSYAIFLYSISKKIVSRTK